MWVIKFRGGFPLSIIKSNFSLLFAVLEEFPKNGFSWIKKIQLTYLLLKSKELGICIGLKF